MFNNYGIVCLFYFPVIHTCQLSASEVSVKPKTKKERLKEMFPALCRANDPVPEVCCFSASIDILAFLLFHKTVSDCRGFTLNVEGHKCHLFNL